MSSNTPIDRKPHISKDLASWNLKGLKIERLMDLAGRPSESQGLTEPNFQLKFLSWWPNALRLNCVCCVRGRMPCWRC